MKTNQLIFQKLSQYCGPSRLVLYGAIVNVFGTFATPFIATQGGPIALEITRFVMGFGQVGNCSFQIFITHYAYR